MSYETQKFLADYGVKHRLSSVAFAQSNKRAELGVKTVYCDNRRSDAQACRRLGLSSRNVAPGD